MFLDVSDNMIQLIQEFTFNGIHIMSSLDLGSQFIASLDERCFKGLTELLTLNLSTNLLTRLESSSFIGIPKMRVDVPIHFTKSVYCCYLNSVKSCYAPSFISHKLPCFKICHVSLLYPEYDVVCFKIHA